MRHAPADRQCRQQDGGEDFPRLQIVLPLDVLIRQYEEILKQDVPAPAFAVREFKRCPQRYQRRRWCRGVDDGTGLVVKNCVVLVFARYREAVATSFSETVIFRCSEIPAAWPL